MSGLKIVAAGHYAPKKVITNEDLSNIVETSDEWIKARTGMEKRHFVSGEEGNTYLATMAARKALEKAQIDPQQIGALVVATFSGDYFVPSTACLVQQQLGLSDDMICFDLNAACSGFVFGLETVRGLLLQSEKPYALLIGSEVISKKLDMTDRGTCILFGDGAGAVLLTLDENKGYTSVLGCHGDPEVINVPTEPVDHQMVHMDGQATYKFAVRTVPEVIKKVADKAGIDISQIDHFICHQANVRILDAVAKNLHLDGDKFYKNIQEYGNTSAASVAIALSEFLENNLCKPGEKLLLAGFGAGKTWGAVILDV